MEATKQMEGDSRAAIGDVAMSFRCADVCVGSDS
jgi:hypothetical protein